MSKTIMIKSNVSVKPAESKGDSKPATDYGMAIQQIELLIDAAHEKARVQGLTKEEDEKLTQLYQNLDKMLEKQAENRVGETRLGQKGSKGRKGGGFRSVRKPSGKHTIYQELAAQNRLLSVWEAREKSGNFVYDEREEQTRIAAARKAKAMKVEERMAILKEKGWDVGMILTMGKSQVRVLGISVDRVNNKGELVHGTGKLKIATIQPVKAGEGVVVIEGQDRNGFYRKVRVKTARQVKVGEPIKLASSEFGMFIGEVVGEVVGDPSWVEPASIK